MAEIRVAPPHQSKGRLWLLILLLFVLLAAAWYLYANRVTTVAPSTSVPTTTP